MNEHSIRVCLLDHVEVRVVDGFGGVEVFRVRT